MIALPPDHRLTTEDKPLQGELDVLAYGLEDYNERHWPGHLPWQEYAVMLRDPKGEVVAGVAGHTYAEWMFVQYLWVSEWLRGGGIGGMLMAQAECMAVERGCHAAFLDTFSFQARGFYERLGYAVFGSLDYPPRFTRHFLQKRLAATADGRPG